MMHNGMCFVWLSIERGTDVRTKATKWPALPSVGSRALPSNPSDVPKMRVNFGRSSEQACDARRIEWMNVSSQQAGSFVLVNFLIHMNGPARCAYLALDLARASPRPLAKYWRLPRCRWQFSLRNDMPGPDPLSDGLT
jgi:hypothetical protein